MIKHIVAWRLKDDAPGCDKAANCERLLAMLEDLPRLVPGIHHFEFGVDIGAAQGPWDVAIYSEFKSRADLDAYQEHPEHIRLKEFAAAVIDGRAVVDYEA
jgi:Stress responsive A/B Barrel Domain